ncbi:hypothetical protein [Streptomyces sp. SID4956]|uniref:hypothetical protein n=1 Tax=Streptomyces sp. SID4956 TaxID=2690290 RepID=UPI00136C1B14|nr:hypothetical protein [Streptomyces sp. SID4956]
MSRYETDKVLWEICRDQAVADAFTLAPHAFLASRALEPPERDALAERDVRALVGGGAHPFLVYNFALRLEGRFSIPFAVRYVSALQGVETGDITT